MTENRCPRCGVSYENGRRNPQSHREACEHARDSPFSGECVMCGEPYDSYTEHLKNCDGSE